MEQRPSQGALMLVREMALFGVSRNEIAARLRDRFGIVDADEVVESAFEPVRRPEHEAEKREKEIA
jgi:hypothetical protein